MTCILEDDILSRIPELWFNFLSSSSIEEFNSVIMKVAILFWGEGGGGASSPIDIYYLDTFLKKDNLSWLYCSNEG